MLELGEGQCLKDLILDFLVFEIFITHFLFGYLTVFLLIHLVRLEEFSILLRIPIYLLFSKALKKDFSKIIFYQFI